MSSESRQDENYTIGYGEGGKLLSHRRASTHAEFILPHLRPGMSLLDCGCGSGTITLGLAEVVSPGNVVGIDIGEDPIGHARSRASDQKVDNIHFKVASLYEIPFEDETFDVVFSHNVIEHLLKPLDALNEMYRVLKPGGVIGITDVDVDAILFSHPNDPIVDLFNLFYRVWEHNGGNPRIGRLLGTMLHEVGFKRIHGSARVDSLGTREEIQYRGDVEMISALSNVCEAAARLGWVDSAEKDRVAEIWSTFAERPGAFASITYCQAIAWKG